MSSSVDEDNYDYDHEFDFGDDFEDNHKVVMSMQETRDCPETAAPTIMIQFKSFPTNREALEKATKQIAEFAQDISGGPICVEMIDRRLVYEITLWASEGSPRFASMLGQDAGPGVRVP